MRSKQGSSEEGDTLHLHRHPGATGAAGKGDPKEASGQYISLSAPESPFNTCSAIIKGISPSVSALQQHNAKLPQHRVLNGRCRTQGLQGDGVGDMGRAHPEDEQRGL